MWTKNAIHHISKQRMLQPSGPCSHSCKSGTLRRLRMRKTGYWPQITEGPIKRTVIGKNQFWLHVGSISLTLAFAIHCFCQGTLPLCLDVKLKWVFFSLQGDFLTLSTCGWSAEKKTLINTPLFCKINGLLTLLPHLLSFFFQKTKKRHPDANNMVILRQ